VNIVVISALFPPEPTVSARIALDLAQALRVGGYSCTVICPRPSRPLGADYFCFDGKDAHRISIEHGFQVVRLPSFAAPNSRLIGRFHESWSFGWEACRYLRDHDCEDADVLYVNVWPIFAQWLIGRYAVRRGVPFVMQIMDIYPESLTQRLPAWIGRIMGWPLYLLDRWTVRHASQLSVISEAMRQTYVEGRGVPADRVSVIPTWQDETLFDDDVDPSAARRRYGVPEGLFTFLYLGNIGPVAGVEFLIEAFVQAQIGSAQLVIAGDGSRKASCMAFATKVGASRVYFISDADVSSVPWLQGMADVCLLPLMPGAGFSSVPSKLPTYMFSGKPVLATVDEESYTARAIVAGRCGWVGKPQDTQWLMCKMREVVEMPGADLEDLGRSGKVYAVEHYSKAENVSRLAGLILSVAGRSGSADSGATGGLGL
jgi:glycosyltransferase involved in cell wall biosynthesis